MPVKTKLAGLATTKEVADYLRVTTRTLENWRANGTGPTWTRLNGKNGEVRYRWSGVEAFVRDGECRAPHRLAASKT